LTVTARGQVTLRKDVLEHLGVQRGGKITLYLLPDGRVELRADRSTGSFRDLSGMLEGKAKAFGFRSKR
jgi:bifunctional DNA-binding transcriptional regulator/antitoxin component of YhaV-PrlF toxin-antitoxin module